MMDRIKEQEAKRLSHRQPSREHRWWWLLAVGGLGFSCAATHAEVPAGMTLIRGSLLVRGGRVIEPFLIDTLEVTVHRYRECVSRGGCEAPTLYRDTLGCNWLRSGASQHPMNCVTFAQAAQFCAWAGGRLPNVSEWDWVAQNRWRRTPYPWGRRRPSPSMACYGHTLNSDGSDYSESTCPVGGANDRTADGVRDMAGNVAEWVRVGSEAGRNAYSSRGAGWSSPSVSRVGYEPLPTVAKAYDTSATVGFRCVRDT